MKISRSKLHLTKKKTKNKQQNKKQTNSKLFAKFLKRIMLKVILRHLINLQVLQKYNELFYGNNAQLEIANLG